MHALSRTHRWLIVLLGLPFVAIISTLVVSQTQISRLVSTDMPLQPAMWVALQLSLASGLLWLLWRDAPQLPSRHALGAALIECGSLFVVALVIGSYTKIIDITVESFGDSLMSMLIFAIPLAWWSMAEERLLRVEMSYLLAHQPVLLRDIAMLIIGWTVQMILLAPYGLFVVIVVLLTESLSVSTWSGSADFARTWTRRWAWRWLIVGGAGMSSTGFVLGTPSLLTITSDDPVALIMIIVGIMVAWVSYTTIQHYLRK